MSRFPATGDAATSRVSRDAARAWRKSALASLALLAAVVIVRPALAVSDSNAWVPGFGLVGADGAVHAASTNLVEGTVTVGGEINLIGDGTAGRIARWDGDSWDPMGNPFNGAVRTIVEKDGFTYAGGDFTKAGFSNTPKVARWNGSQWQSLGTGIQGPAVGTRVNSIAFFQDNLYVAGNFTKAGGENAADIAYWDGDAWHAIGDTDVNGEIHEIVVHGTRLCAAGAFTQIGGLDTEGVACWTGTQWQALDGGLNGAALAAVVLNGDLFVGGSFSFAGGVSTGRVAKWNGLDWQSVGYPLTQQVLSLGSRGSILIVGANGGSTTDPAKPWMIEWNGIQWTNAPEQPDGAVLGFAPSPAGALVVGAFPRANQTVLGGVGVWTGGIFVTYVEGSQRGLHGNANAFAVWNGELYVAGSFKAAGDEPAGLVAKWNVDHWESVGNYAVNGSASVEALVAGEDGLYAGGRFGLIGGVEVDNVARWDGAVWSPVGTGFDNRVSALLAHDGKIYAGGTFLHAGEVPASKLAVWDGVEWASLVDGGGGVSGDVSTLAAFEGDVVAGGAFTSAAGPVLAHGVVRFDGAQFEALGDGIDGTVRALHVHDGTLYAGGSITASGETTLSGLARWSGSQWQPVGTGVRLGNAAGSVLAMTSVGDTLFLGGSFSRAGDVETRQIARYENGTWLDIAPGFREPASTGGESVSALAVHDDTLWLGGNFLALADGRPAARVIAWAGCAAGNEAGCAATTTTTTESPITTTTLVEAMCGDANDDGDVTAADALFALRAAVGIRDCELEVCDADGSGKVTATDALMVLRHAVGQPVELDCP